MIKDGLPSSFHVFSMAPRPVAELPFAARLGVTASTLVLGLIMIVISPFDELPLIRGELRR